METEEIKQKFQEEWVGKADEYVENPDRMESLGKTALGLLQKGGLKTVVEDIKLLVGYVTDIAKGQYKDYSGGNLSLVVAALVYLVSPIDLIPDVLPVIGWTDDVAVIGFICKKLHDELQVYKCWKTLENCEEY